jgi:hypothetical protein
VEVFTSPRDVMWNSSGAVRWTGAARSPLRQSVLESRCEGVNVCFVDQLSYPLVRDLGVNLKLRAQGLKHVVFHFSADAFKPGT